MDSLVSYQKDGLVAVSSATRTNKIFDDEPKPPSDAVGTMHRRIPSTFSTSHPIFQRFILCRRGCSSFAVVCGVCLSLSLLVIFVLPILRVDPIISPTTSTSGSKTTTTSWTAISMLNELNDRRKYWSSSYESSVPSLSKTPSSDFRSSRHHTILQLLHDLDTKMDGSVYFAPSQELYSSFSSSHHLSTTHEDYERGTSGRDRKSAQEYMEAARSWRTADTAATALADDATTAIAATSEPHQQHHHHRNYAPLAIIEVASIRDVQLAVPLLAQLSRNDDFSFTIRSGGHHKAGFSTTTSTSFGVVLSLRQLNDIKFNNDDQDNDDNVLNDASSSSSSHSRIVTLGPGATVYQVIDHVVVQAGYNGVFGFCGSVAEGGFVLGGGYGMMSRMYGLGLDNVVAFKVVLANGELVTASSQNHHSSLFWALRGAGGGNFGVVTEMSYMVHRHTDQFHYLAIMDLQPSELATVLYGLGKLEPYLPGNVLTLHDQKGTVNFFWSGSDMDKGKDYLHDLVTKIGPVDVLNRTTELTSDFATIFGDHRVPNDKYSWGDSVWAAACWCGYLMPENNTLEVWNDILHHVGLGLAESPHLLPDIELWGGAISKPLPNASAFPYRGALYNVGVLLMIPSNESNAEAVFQKEYYSVRQWWPKVEQYLVGSYVNYPSIQLLDHPDTHHYAKVYWGDNLNRLVQVKERYDPDNVFRFPMSVPLSVQ